jgi:DNA recombination protein RmuC
MAWLIPTLVAVGAVSVAAVLIAHVVRTDVSGISGHLAVLGNSLERMERTVHDEVAEGRRDNAAATLEARREARDTMRECSSLVLEIGVAVNNLSGSNVQQLELVRNTLHERLTLLQERNEQRLDGMREDARRSAQEVVSSQQRFRDDTTAILDSGRTADSQRNDAFQRMMEERSRALEETTGRRLDEIRIIVDEKLQSTLDKRLGESFRQVSDRLEQVHRGLGEVQSLAQGVGDLKRVLANVRTRGAWGEVQLRALLEQMLSPGQYATNVEMRPGSGERVEFAVLLPGRDGGGTVWLPIDSKFPLDKYQQLVDAADRADQEAVERAATELERNVKLRAREIRDKYLEPPSTTDFAILFLPTEGLYAEVLRRPGIVEQLQQEMRIVVAGPTTLMALLNSLQMGFQTLAIQKRSEEIGSLLRAVSTEFGRFGDVLGKVKKKLAEASSSIEQAEVRSRVIDRKLRRVDGLGEQVADEPSTGDVLELAGESA